MSLMDYLEHKRREKERQIKWEIAKRKYEDEAKITLGTVIGASLGLAAGLLLAPKSGEETRKDIKKFAEETKKTAVNNFNDAVDTVKLTADNVTDSVKDKYQDFQDRGMTELNRVSDQFDEVKADLGVLGEDLKEVVKKDGKEIKEDVKDTKDQVKDSAEKVGDSAKKVAEEAKDGAEKTVEEGKKQAKKTAETAKEEAKEVKKEIKK